MLREDPLGGEIGSFRFRGTTLDYHVEGGGLPVLIAHGLSARGSSYDWRYIYDCLAGAFLVYALDVTGSSDRLEYGRAHYSGLIETFIRKVIRGRTSIIASPVEAPFVLMAAFQAPKSVEKIMLTYTDGTIKIRTRCTIGREAVERRLGIPSIEEITGGKPWLLCGCSASLRRFATGRIAGISGCNALFHRAGAPPGGIDPMRFCDDAIRFLGQ
jgi:pimeloyl-ACP methyl ester carboxylesterase